MKNKYGFSELTDAEAMRIQQAEAELAECQGCTGQCQKRLPDYLKPRIQKINGKLRIELEYCEHYRPPVVKAKAKSDSEPDFDAISYLKLFDVEKFRREYREKKDRERPRIMRQYGLSELSEETLEKILGAEEEIAKCAGCKGAPCQKRAYQYEQWRIEVDGQAVNIEKGMCNVKAEEKLKTLRRQCFIPPKYLLKTFADYEVTRDNEEAIKIAKWFLKKKPAKGIYLYGEVGTGKTFLASIIAQEWLRSLKTVVFGDVPTLLSEIKKAFDKSSEENAENVLDRYCKCSLLILDDIGAGQITEWNVGQLYQIINTRYNSNKPTILTSNFDLEGLKSRLSIKSFKGEIIDNFSATRITSRLAEMCELTFLGTTDRRK